MPGNTDQEIRKLRFLEQALQQILMKKQSIDLELSEIKSALNELNSAGPEVYKIIGQIMIKTGKEKIREELENKERFLKIKLKGIEKQETSVSEKIDSLKKDLNLETNKKQ